MADDYDWDLTPEQWGKFDKELREEFPKETARFDEAVDRLIDKDGNASIHIEYCEEMAKKGTGFGVCDAALDAHGQCPHWRNHVEE